MDNSVWRERVTGNLLYIHEVGPDHVTGNLYAEGRLSECSYSLSKKRLESEYERMR